MEFVRDYWFLWLIITGGLVAYAAYNQIQRISRIMKQDLINGRMEDLTKGTGLMFAAIIASGDSLVLLLVSIALNIITYIKS